MSHPKVIFAITDQDILIYRVDSWHPSTINLTCSDSATNQSCPVIDKPEIAVKQITGEWRLLYHPDWDLVILNTEELKTSQRECNRLYGEYKSICPKNLFGFQVYDGKPLTYYYQLITELTNCRDTRLEVSYRCQQIDSGHTQAIIQANNLRNQALNKYRQVQLNLSGQPNNQEPSDVANNIFQSWTRGEIDNILYLVELLKIPRQTMIAKIINSNPEVLRILFPLQTIGELNIYDLTAAVIYLDLNGYPGLI